MGFNGFAGQLDTHFYGRPAPRAQCRGICKTCIKLFRVVLMCSDKYNPGNTLKANVPRLAGFIRALLWLAVDILVSVFSNSP